MKEIDGWHVSVLRKRKADGKLFWSNWQVQGDFQFALDDASEIDDNAEIVVIVVSRDTLRV